MSVSWTVERNNILKTLIEGPRMGLITDVDGTISPIVDDPAAAQVTPHARELLAALAEHLPLVAALSGRAADDIHRRVGVEGLVYVGNHGFDQWVDGRVAVVPEAAPHRAGLDALIGELDAYLEPGMFVEDKGATLSLHYRQAADPARIAAEKRPHMAALAESHGIELFEGRMIFEFRPPVAINKGTAFRGLINHYELDTAIYIGDDVTDLDAFRAARALREAGDCFALTCGVVADETPPPVIEEADVIAQGVAGVESLLSWLLKALMASAT